MLLSIKGTENTSLAPFQRLWRTWHVVSDGLVRDEPTTVILDSGVLLLCSQEKSPQSSPSSAALCASLGSGDIRVTDIP